MPTPTPNAKVGFKRGTQAALNTLINGNGERFAEGTFYLTSDSNRLYFAQSTQELVDLNQYIRIVDALPTGEALTHVEPGDFYYISSGNILAIRNENNNGWTQLNPDTNTELVASSTGITVASVTDGARVSSLVSDSSGKEVSGNFQILGSTNVTVTPDATNRTITISTPANTNTTYTLSTSESATQGTINLTGSDNINAGTIHFIAGDNIGIADNGAGNITISGAPSVSSVSNSFDANGNFITTIEQGDSADVVSTTGFQPGITYGDSATTAHFGSNNNVVLNVYSKSEVDTAISNAIQVADAMTFKGVLGENDLVPTENVKKGDTYKLAADKVSVSAKLGDLIIAQGEEGTNGYITTPTWAVVPSGDDQVLVANNSASNKRFEIFDNVGQTTLNKLTFLEDTATDKAKVSITATEATGGLDITLAHSAPGTGTAITPAAVVSGTTLPASGSIDIPVVTGITKDANGHITAVTASTYRVIDTHASMDDITYNVSVTGSNSASFAATTGLDGGANKSFTQTINSSTLKITNANITGANAAGITLDLEWGSF